MKMKSNCYDLFYEYPYDAFISFQKKFFVSYFSPTQYTVHQIIHSFIKFIYKAKNMKLTNCN